MDLHVSFTDRSGLAEQIYAQVRAAIERGQLRPHEGLPSVRDLARRLDVSRATVATAYDRLAAGGFVVSRVGSGTFVAETVPAAPPEPTRVGGPLAARPIWKTVPVPEHLNARYPFEFRVGFIDKQLFPFPAWRRHMADELRVSGSGMDLVGDSAGHPLLRAGIARYLAVSRAVRADAADVVVTNGSQQAVDLISRVLLEPGDIAAVEDPGYPLHRRLLEVNGARVVPVPVDEEGIVVDALPAGCRMVVVSPSHQFPLGVPMSPARRRALLDWADRQGVAVVEDDYDGDFRFDGRPLETLYSLDTAGRVIFVGSFSKSMLPTFRLGFLIAPPELRDALRAAKHLSDWHTALPTQAALAHFLEDGGLARHVRRVRAIYQGRRERMLEVVARDFAGVLDPYPAVAGLHISFKAKDGDMRQVIERAAAAGIAAYRISVFAVNPVRHDGLVLAYGAADRPTIEEGLRRLRPLLDNAVA